MTSAQGSSCRSTSTADHRAAKYAVMFLAAAFMAVFMIELRSDRAVHPVQYFFVGFAMVFFYVLLLSIAEYLGFARAYIAAACATGGMLSVYVARVQQSVPKGGVMFAVFLVLYGFLYIPPAGGLRAHHRRRHRLHPADRRDVRDPPGRLVGPRRRPAGPGASAGRLRMIPKRSHVRTSSSPLRPRGVRQREGDAGTAEYPVHPPPEPV